MRVRVSVLAVLLRLPAAAEPPRPQPPAAQESILAAHEVGVSLGVGVDLTSFGAADGSYTSTGVMRLTSRGLRSNGSSCRSSCRGRACSSERATTTRCC